MKTKTINIYSFDELSESAKETARNWFRDGMEYFIGSTEDAEQIGLNITEYDIYHQSIKGKFTQSAMSTMWAIEREHGEDCETYRTAQQFKTAWAELVKKHSDGINTDIVTEDNQYEFDQEADELEEEFLRELLEDYLVMIRKDYEYQESDEWIDENIRINEYEFTEKGKIA